MVNGPYTTKTEVDHNLLGVYQRDMHLCLIAFGLNHRLHYHRQNMEQHLHYDILCHRRTYSARTNEQRPDAEAKTDEIYNLVNIGLNGKRRDWPQGP